MKTINESWSLFQSVIPKVVGNPRLREPQREAYFAVKEHFAFSSEPALVQIPVGGGKTGLISILPFGIARYRTLIVAPNRTIRDSIFTAVNSASPSCFWRTTGVASPSVIGPFAAVLDGPSANFADCIDSHYVVTNVQQIGQASNRWLRQMPSDFFDMILIDEGHHNAAASWKRLIEHFPRAKIISLTATPFRSDGLKITGKPIYRYTFRRAMSQGYIKTLKAEQVLPCEISFTFGDSSEMATLAQVMELREEAWFSRGIALADECNRHIVASSVAACERLRREGTKRHQIIAAACSVEHARAIVKLYFEAGYKAAEIHSKQAKATQRHVLSQLRSGAIDVIVQVQMLGEGFDHPSLSVAAIFRPFRSLSPYVQFVGRVMRVLVQEAPGDIDNRGIVVSHVGLNTERHWEQFRQVDVEDQELWASLISGEDEPDPIDKESNIIDLDDEDSDENSEEKADAENKPQMLVDWELIGQTTISTYDFISGEQQDLVQAEVASVATVVGPQERRRQAKSRLTGEVDQAVRNTLHRTRLNAMGSQLSRVHPILKGQRNWGAARYWFYYTLNQRVGRKPKSGKDWSLEEAEQALEILPSLVDELVGKVPRPSNRSYY